MGDPNTQVTPLTFKDEDARIKALSELPDEPPVGVNIEQWFDDIAEQRDAIENAAIDPEMKEEEVASPQDQPAEEDPPTNQPQEDQGQTGSEAEESQKQADILEFKINRSELPEELQSYSNAGEILKQYGHARKYANSLDSRLSEINKENELLKQKVGQIDSLQAKITEMENARNNLQNKIDSGQQNKQSSQQAQSHLDDLNASIANLNSMKDDDFVSVADVRKVLSTATEEIGNTVNALGQTREEFDTYRTQTNDVVKGLEKKLDGYLDNQTLIQSRQESDQRLSAMFKEIESLQESNPELKTSKPVFSLNGEASVESAVSDFASRVALVQSGTQAPDWNYKNRVINAFLRDDPEIKAFCQNNGINPEAFGIDKQDMRAYATIANVDAHMRGGVIDEYTGVRKTLTNPLNGQPVNFPSFRSAYKHILDESGYTQAQIDDLRREAEIKGQQSLEESLMNRDNSNKTLSGAGEASPDNIGEELSEEQAVKILNEIDEEKLEFQARKGNRAQYHLYNKALKRLKIPEMNPDPLWPAERQKQTA